MQRAEIVPAFLIALVTLVLGFLLFRYLFDSTTLKIKPRFLGTGERIAQWFRAHGRMVALAVLAVAVACVLLVLAIRFTGPLVRAKVTGLPEPPPLAERVMGASP